MPYLLASPRVLTDGPDLLDPAQVGHKFARQVRLTRAGFTVPPLVCLPATVFDDVVGGIRDSTEVRGLSLPDALRAALDSAVAGLVSPGALLAVRACVVADADGAGEDSGDDPFAGLSSSFLYVAAADVAARVVDCWASAYHPEAVFYRSRKGLDPFGARVAVGIQPMVMGDRSFVAFTRDPRGGPARTVIAAAHGIGEGVVAERADIDHFFVDAESGVITSHLVSKARAVGFDPGRPQAGPVPIPVPTPATDPVLTESEVRGITAITGRVAEFFEAPQDIEGAIDPDGTIWLVQARPIVAASEPAVITWDNSNITESFPGVSTALTFSVARELYETGFTDLYRRMGVPERVLGPNRPHLQTMIGQLHGRIYYRLGCWYHLHAQLRCFRPLWSTWEQSLGLPRRPGRSRERFPRVRTALAVIEIVLRLAGHPRRMANFLSWWDGYHAELADIAGLSPDEAVRRYRQLWTEVGRRWGVTLVNGIFLFAATLVTGRAVTRWAPGADRAVLDGLLVGGPPNRSAAALESALALVDRARRSPSILQVLQSDLDPREAWPLLLADPDYAAALTEHLRRYGDRSLHDLKLESSTPRQQPWTLLPIIRGLLSSSLTDSRKTARNVRRRATAELRRHCSDPVRRRLIVGSYALMRRLMRVREDVRFCRTELFGDSRALLLRLGDALVADGVLPDDDAVFHLTVDEVLGAFDGTAPADLAGLSAVRAAEHRRWLDEAALPARVRTPLGRPTQRAVVEVARPAPDTSVRTELSGLPSSAGLIRARARVVLDPTTSAEDCAGCILIARETDPGWLFLMTAAVGLVVERGTLLSHTAITGRLLGIPTVVSVAGATTAIPDGALVELDGSRGTVRILEVPPC